MKVLSLTEFFDFLESELGSPDSKKKARKMAQKLANNLGVPDCGAEGCPLHGAETGETEEDDARNILIDQPMLDAIDSKAALDLSIAATASAHNSIVKQRPDSEVTIRQTQAMLWVRLAERMRQQEDEQASQPDPEPVKDDLPEQSPFDGFEPVSNQDDNSVSPSKNQQ